MAAPENLPTNYRTQHPDQVSLKNLKQGHSGPMTRSDLEQKWWEEHKVSLHDSHEPLSKEDTSMNRMTLCALQGVCVCKDKDGQLALRFWRKLTQCMKVYLIKINKKPSAQRQQFETGGFVLGLRPSDTAQRRVLPETEVNLEEIFFHVGHANYRTWDFACVHLKKLSHDESSGVTTLTALDCENNLIVKSAVQYFKEMIDFRYPWSLQYYVLLSDMTLVETLDHMQPQFLQIKEHLHPYPFWKGAHLELKRRAGTRQQGRQGQAPQSSKQASQQKPRGAPRRRTAHSDGGLAALGQDDEGAHGHSAEYEEGDEDNADLVLDDLDQLWEDLEMVDEEEEEDGIELSGDKDLFEQLLDFDHLNLKAHEEAEVELESEVVPGPSDAAGDALLVPPKHQMEEQELADNPIVPAPEEQKKRKTHEGEAVVRATKVSEDVFHIPQPIGGDLRFNQRGFLRAHCDNPDHTVHGPCTRQRQVTKGRRGAGRPIGSLIAWLQDSDRCKTRAEHIAQPAQSFARRKQARELFASWTGAAQMLAKERPRFEWEAQDEPDEIP